MHYTISDYLLDITHNAIEAGSSLVSVRFNETSKFVEVTVEDNGKGMDSETLEKSQNPFYSDPKKHVARKFGFGLPFLIQAVELGHGEFSINSSLGKGTVVKFNFDKECVDTPPLGDLPGTFLSMLMLENCREVRVERLLERGKYSISRLELLDALGDLSDIDSILLAKEYICSLEDNLISVKTNNIRSYV